MVRKHKQSNNHQRGVNTNQGLTDMAVRQYITDADRALTRWSIPLLAPVGTAPGSTTEQRALAMYAEDERLRNMADMHDAAVNAAKTDGAQGMYILRQSRDTFMRTGDYGYQGTGPK